MYKIMVDLSDLKCDVQLMLQGNWENFLLDATRKPTNHVTSCAV